MTHPKSIALKNIVIFQQSSRPTEIKEAKRLGQSLLNSLDIYSKEFWIKVLTYFIFYTLFKALTKIFMTSYQQ